MRYVKNCKVYDTEKSNLIYCFGDRTDQKKYVSDELYRTKKGEVFVSREVTTVFRELQNFGVGEYELVLFDSKKDLIKYLESVKAKEEIYHQLEIPLEEA